VFIHFEISGVPFFQKRSGPPDLAQCNLPASTNSLSSTGGISPRQNHKLCISVSGTVAKPQPKIQWSTYKKQAPKLWPKLKKLTCVAEQQSLLEMSVIYKWHLLWLPSLLSAN
jgi:hypothetical protein